MSGIYTGIRDTIQATWATRWTHSDVPVFWSAQEVATPPDPATAPRFVRLELLYGRERLMAFGAGRMANERSKYGSLVVRVYQDVSLLDDAPQLDLLSDAETIFRGYRSGPLSFIGVMAGFDQDASGVVVADNGNWTMQGSLLVWEYRFVG